MDQNQNGRHSTKNAPATVTLTARPEKRLIRAGGSVRHVDFGLAVSKPASDVTATRTPVRLALVLDRSGSMAGAKLPTAKRATLAVVDLLDQRDEVAVIAFDSTV